MSQIRVVANSQTAHIDRPGALICEDHGPAQGTVKLNGEFSLINNSIGVAIKEANHTHTTAFWFPLLRLVGLHDYDVKHPVKYIEDGLHYH